MVQDYLCNRNECQTYAYPIKIDYVKSYGFSVINWLVLIQKSDQSSIRMQGNSETQPLLVSIRNKKAVKGKAAKWFYSVWTSKEECTRPLIIMFIQLFKPHCNTIYTVIFVIPVMFHPQVHKKSQDPIYHPFQNCWCSASFSTKMLNWFNCYLFI